MTSARGIFITGTDTGVGKTLVACALVRVLASRGHRVVGLKPIASGAEVSRGGLRNSDALALAAESSVELPYELTNPYCFAPAVAPHVAAAEAGVCLTPDELVDWYGRAAGDAEFAIVEGAGGWRVPLHPDGFLSDLPERLGLGVVLVVGLRLGCLNHARLTLEAISNGGRCPFAGWVGSQSDAGFARIDANVATLERLLGTPPLAIIPPLAEPTAGAVAKLLVDARLFDAQSTPS